MTAFSDTVQSFLKPIVLLVLTVPILAGCSGSDDDDFYWRIEWNSGGACSDPNQRGGGSLGTFDPGLGRCDACGEITSRVKRVRLRLSLRISESSDANVFALSIEREIGLGEGEDFQRVMRSVLWTVVIDELHRSLGDPKNWPPEVIDCLPLAEIQGMIDRGGGAHDIQPQPMDVSDPSAFEYSVDLGTENGSVELNAVLMSGRRSK
jgi:hypothetical protein